MLEIGAGVFTPYGGVVKKNIPRCLLSGEERLTFAIIPPVGGSPHVNILRGLGGVSIRPAFFIGVGFRSVSRISL